ncbi:Plant Tudor-like protein [Euphorbia peplus]|nr:Plant Tudor-like protein [Euphorbia peplus]
MRVFSEGDEVEVCSNELGYVGSYYEATVIQRYHDQYKVKYKNLVVEEGSSVPLIEVVSSGEVRSVPPKHPTVGLSIRKDDVVDALDKDGWWVGRVTGQTYLNGEYNVYFPTTDETVAYPASRLRKHVNWCNGNWIFSKNQFWWNGHWISTQKKFFLSLPS